MNMHTYQIAEQVLDDYRNNKLTDERIDFLKAQVDEQLEELSENQELYEGFLKKVNAPETIDNVILWILLMSDEDIVETYIDEYGKKYREIIPVSDLADLLLYVVHLNKVKNTTLEGFDYLLEYEHGGIDEMDQYCVTNVLLFIQKSKEPQIEF